MEATPEQLAARVAGVHLRSFGTEPEAAAFAPGRVNLIGDHTDYDGGLVLPAALGLGCVCTVSRAPQGPSRVQAADLGESAAFSPRLSPDAAARLPRWARYVAGVCTLWQQAHPGIGLAPVSMTVGSTVPRGSGLSSSAALEVGVATALDGLAGVATPDREKAQLCRRAEQEYAGVPCGVMDQFIACAAVEGHALCLDCRSLEASAVPLPRQDRARFVLFDTGVSHRNDDGAYADRRLACEEAARALGVASLRDVPLDRARRSRGELSDRAARAVEHVSGENGRVRAFVRALDAGEYAEAGRLMTASHDSLSRVLRVSCVEADRLVERLTQTPGVLGARMTGAGFGGWVVALVESDGRMEGALGRAALLPPALRELAGRTLSVEGGGGARVLG